MNTLMYEHPLTGEHLRIIKDIVKYNVVGPIGKVLACGDIGKRLIPALICVLTLFRCVGVGAMTEWKDIIQIVVERFNLKEI